MVQVKVEQKKEKQYPRLMISSDDIIVLFYSDKKGTVVNDSQIWGLGDYSENWNMNLFTDFNGSITLQNQ